MKPKTYAEMVKARNAKIARTAIRLKYSLLADEELNDKIPALLSEFDTALAEGQVKQLNIGIADLLSEINT